MAKKKISPWLWGCGIGCGGLVIIAVIVAGGGFMFLRNTFSGFEEAVELRARLEAEHGKVEEYVPPVDGVIPADRIEVFLRVREGSAEPRVTIVDTFRSFPMTEEEARKLEEESGLEAARQVLGMVGAGVGLGGRIGELLAARNAALLEHGMGMGEYTYIYVIAYYSWLQHSPQDGPENLSDNVKVNVGRLDGRVHRRISSILQNQLQAARETGNPALEREVEALEADRRRVPYADGLPPAMQATLEPYRERLEASYEEVTNQFELSLLQRKGNFSIQAE